MKKLTTENFIEKSKKIHGDKYDYSLVDYINSSTKIKIICPIHGTFEQVPSSHMNNVGCSICSGKKRLTKKEFIIKANQVHNNKYDYHLVEYRNNSTKIKIICDQHGVFEQTPNRHVSKKQGCSICYGNKKSTTEEFIIKANKKHFNKYDYSLVKYESCMEKVDIVCKKHGLFKQKPNCHLNGQGCPVCKLSKGEKKVKYFLNKKNITYIQQYIFNDCVNIRPLPFDFYLPTLNICIEYDGVQHFKPYGWDKSGNRFKTTVKNDKIKNQYCLNNNIGLIRIKYNDNIDSILSSYFMDRH